MFTTLMKLKIYEKALVRVPQFSLDAGLEESWPALKDSIRDASSYFYNIIRDLDYADVSTHPLNVRLTIAKYFNRARFRATPYGSFASVGVCGVTSGRNSNVVIDTEKREYRFPDWELTEAAKYWKQVPLKELYLQSNSSYYRFGASLRYIFKGRDTFELSDVPFYKEVDHILQCCAQTLSYVQLKKKCAALEFEEGQLEAIVDELIELQLLSQISIQI